MQADKQVLVNVGSIPTLGFYMDKKVALFCMKSSTDLLYSEMCEVYGWVGCDHCNEEAINLAVKSLDKHIQLEKLLEGIKDFNNNTPMENIKLLKEIQ